MEVVDIYCKLDNSILLCYEESNEFCHRHIVAECFHLLLNIEILEVIVWNEFIKKVERPNVIREYLKEIIENENINIGNKLFYQFSENKLKENNFSQISYKLSKKLSKR